MSKKKPSKDGIIYSTDPSFNAADEEEVTKSLSPAGQKLAICLDTRHRAGKAVTLVQGFIGNRNDLEELGKKLKNFCGTGGSAKDGAIIIQGDQRAKVFQWLTQNGYSKTRKI